MDGDQMDVSIYLPRKDQEFHVTGPSLWVTFTSNQNLWTTPPTHLEVNKRDPPETHGQYRKTASSDAKQLQNHARAKENR